MIAKRLGSAGTAALLLSGWAAGCSPTTPPTPAPVRIRQRTVRFVVVSQPPGALILHHGDTVGPAPVVIQADRRGVPGLPGEVYLRALPRQEGQCPQRITIAYDESTPDTVRFDMTRCLPPGQDYDRIFDDSEVTTPAERISSPPVRYPDEQRRAGIAGRVILRLVIDTTGRADPGSIEVLVASHPNFIPPARYVCLTSIFEPARVHGRKVRVRVRFPINFSIARSD